MHKGTFEYTDGATICEGYVASDGKPGRKPCVLIAHQWAGLFEQEQAKAEYFAGKGYVGFAIDVYGKGVRGAHGQDNSAYMGPYLNDRAKLRQRLLAAVAAAKARPDVDPNRIAIIGYCFGGTTSLEIARSGADVKAVVGFHSGLATARPQDAANIKARVLVCIGADDPIIPPEQRLAFEKEMKSAGIDWRLQLYGGAGHSFTNPAADSRGMKGFFYHEATDRRSWNAMIELFGETLN